MTLITCPDHITEALEQDARVLMEAELALAEQRAAWADGERKGCVEALQEKQQQREELDTEIAEIGAALMRQEDAVRIIRRQVEEAEAKLRERSSNNKAR